MADNDDLDLGDEGGAAAPAKKGGGIKNLITGMLKWIIIGVAAIIVVITIVIVAISINNHNQSKNQSVGITTEDYTSGQRETYDWYKSIGTIQTFTSDEPAATVRVNVFLGYKKDDKATSTEITSRSVEIKEFLRRYFRGKTASELKNANNEEKFQMEIRNGINDKVLSGSKIRAVSFDELSVVDPN